MKKSLLFLLSCCLATSVFSQTNTFPTNGNTGIGTLSPDSKLHVVGDTRSDGTIGGNGAFFNVLKITPLINSPAYFYINTNIPASDNYAPQLQITGYTYISTNKAMKLTLGWYHYQDNFYWSQYQSDIGYHQPSRIRLGKYLKNGIAYVRIEIANDGVYWASYNISATDVTADFSAYTGWNYLEGEMPTTTTTEIIEVPQAKITIRDNFTWGGYDVGNPHALKIGHSGGNYGGIGYNLDFTTTTGIFNRPLIDQSSYLEFTNGGFSFYGTANSNSATGIHTNGGGNNLNRFATITKTGNFGIGTETPSEKLTIAGNSKLLGDAPAYLINYASLSETTGGLSTIVGNNVKSGISPNSVKKISNPHDPGSFMSLNYYYGITFHTGVETALNLEVPVQQSEKMRITQAGNVGIGTASPSEKLSVNGKIRAHEIKVETTNWPDYVFEEGYKLDKLEDLANYIKLNKHLPEIPTAKEVEANGIELGEMNKLLLKKVEELTLLLIQKDKEIKIDRAQTLTNTKMILELTDLINKMNKKQKNK